MEERKKVKLDGKFIGIVIILLLIVIIICAYKNGTGDRGQSGTLTVIYAEETVKMYTLEDLKSLESIDVEKEIISGSQAPERGIFTGVPLEVLLNDADESLLDKCKTFVLTAADGYGSAVSANEISNGNNVLVVYAKDGEDLVPFNKGGAGPIRIVIVEDAFGNRSTKDLVEIEAK